MGYRAICIGYLLIGISVEGGEDVAFKTLMTDNHGWKRHRFVGQDLK
jgi:hypothetical protein